MAKATTPTVAKEILKRIADLNNGIKSQEKDLNAQLDILLKNHAPVKAGDVVRVTGASFSGKNMTVDKVFVEDGNGLHFRAYGRVHVGDGTPGLRKAEARFELKAAK